MRQYIFSLLSITFLTFTTSAWALNGAQLTGFTAINESLGGSGVAAPQDISTMIINPAGLTQIPDKVNFNIFLAWPKSQMDTSAAGAGNAGGLVTSNDDPILLPGGGLNLSLTDDLYFGVGIIPTAGMSLDYPTSRVSAAFTADTYDTHTLLALMKITPSLAYQINDRLSVGLSLHIDRSQFETNSALPPVFSPTLDQTTGRDRSDFAFGLGFGIGAIYQPWDFLSAGVSYTSEQWMQEFERYQDLLPSGLNFPQQVNAGLSITPIDKIRINTDFRWINWSGVTGGFGTSVANGGLGWRDQYIALFGIQYDLCDFLTLRSGYNYAASPIPSDSVFASQLASPIGEHHLGGGFGIKLAHNLGLDFSYLHTFSNTVTDNGTQNGGVGQNAFTRQSINQMNSEISWEF